MLKWLNKPDYIWLNQQSQGQIKYGINYFHFLNKYLHAKIEN